MLSGLHDGEGVWRQLYRKRAYMQRGGWVRVQRLGYGYGPRRVAELRGELARKGDFADVSDQLGGVRIPLVPNLTQR